MQIIQMRQIKHEGPRENGTQQARCWEDWETTRSCLLEEVETA